MEESVLPDKELEKLLFDNEQKRIKENISNMGYQQGRTEGVLLTAQPLFEKYYSITSYFAFHFGRIKGALEAIRFLNLPKEKEIAEISQLKKEFDSLRIELNQQSDLDQEDKRKILEDIPIFPSFL